MTRKANVIIAEPLGSKKDFNRAVNEQAQKIKAEAIKRKLKKLNKA